MKKLQELNKRTAPKSVMPEKVIQFGEGNFLRAFVDWILWNMNQKTDFNGSVVVVQPIERGMVDWLNGQDCLYHVNLQGRENGETVNSLERIDVISRALNPYTQNWAYMALADQPEIRFVISNTTDRLRRHLQVERRPRQQLSRQVGAVALSPLSDLRGRPHQGPHHHALRVDFPQRPPSERVHLQIHRTLEGRLRRQL